MPVEMTLWAWLGVLAMTVGTVPPLWLWYSTGTNGTYYATLAGVTGFAALAYLAMALEIGNVSTEGGLLPVARYVDWLVTTPLILLYLGLLARPPRRVLAGLIGADVVIIIGGVVAVATTGTLSWVAFGIGVATYGLLVYGLLVTLPESVSVETDRVRAVFGTLRNITVVLWTLYPVVWLVAPTGFGLITVSTEMLVFVYLDIVAKVGFVVVAAAGADAISDLDDIDTAQPTTPAVEASPKPGD
ncbi:sensory rhodopsin II [Halorubrum luteum]